MVKKLTPKRTVPKAVAVQLGKLIYRKEGKIPASFAPSIVTGLIDIYGIDEAKSTMYILGRRLGKEQLENAIKNYGVSKPKELETYLGDMEIGFKLMANMDAKIVEATDKEILLRVKNCMYCKGLKNYEKPICDFQSGSLAGSMEYGFPDLRVSVEEIKCSAAGDEYCEYRISMRKD